MPFTAEISRSNPTCLLFLVDQSSSMTEPFAGQPDRRKADGVADALNRLLQTLVLKCAKADGIRDFFHVGLLSYGGEVKSGLGGALAGQTLVPVSQLANYPLRVEDRKRKVEDGAGGMVEVGFKFPVWFEPRIARGTPMNAALEMAREYVSIFLQRFPDCYPPQVINITDGMPTDVNPLATAQALREQSSSDGNVLLYNAHISSSPANPVEYPATEDALPDKFARLLFRMSSTLPERVIAAARSEGLHLQPEARGFVFNADLVAVIRFLDIGTRVAQDAR